MKVFLIFCMCQILKQMNLNGLHLFLLLSNSRRMKSNGIFIFLPLLDSKTMNLIMILSLITIRLCNHELKVFSYILFMLNSETLNLDKSSYIWPLSNFGTLNLDQSSYILPLSNSLTMNLHGLHMFCLLWNHKLK